MLSGGVCVLCTISMYRTYFLGWICTAYKSCTVSHGARLGSKYLSVDDLSVHDLSGWSVRCAQAVLHTSNNDDGNVSSEVCPSYIQYCMSSYRLLRKKPGKNKEATSTMRFELTRAKPNGLAGRRLNHSATSTFPCTQLGRRAENATCNLSIMCVTCPSYCWLCGCV